MPEHWNDVSAVGLLACWMRTCTTETSVVSLVPEMIDCDVDRSVGSSRDEHAAENNKRREKEEERMAAAHDTNVPLVQARADLCRRLGRTAEARESYERALALARQEPERRFLHKRLRELG